MGNRAVRPEIANQKWAKIRSKLFTANSSYGGFNNNFTHRRWNQIAAMVFAAFPINAPA
jgi:hypothetical protein